MLITYKETKNKYKQSENKTNTDKANVHTLHCVTGAIVLINSLNASFVIRLHSFTFNDLIDDC